MYSVNIPFELYAGSYGFLLYIFIYLRLKFDNLIFFPNSIGLKIKWYYM